MRLPRKILPHNRKTNEAATSARRRRAPRRSIFEPLEARRMLAAEPIISEFLARNDAGLTDAAGRTSDWIEIHNAGDQPIDLAGWHLTDDARALDKWTFPTTPLEAGGQLVVFATGDGVPDSEGNLHTNFRLAGRGEYLALTRPDLSIASQFAPAYPPQFADVSYGIEQTFITTTLVADGAPAQLLVPRPSDEPAIVPDWTSAPQPPGDRPWLDVTAGIGYDEALPLAPITNVARNRPAAESTSGFNLTASNAVDGIRRGSSISRTATGDLQPWWEVDLGDDWFIESVVIFTRDDCCTFERDYNLTVEIRTATDEPLFVSELLNRWDGNGRPADLGLGASLTVDLTQAAGGGVTGRKVRVRKAGFEGSEWLQLAEVEVMAREYPPGPLSKLVSTDVENELKGENASVLLRVPFQVADAAELGSATLRMQYNDGFVAYVNGAEVGRANAPVGTPSLTAGAVGMVDRAATIEMDVPVALLRDGANLLAIDGLNRSADDGDFLIRPTLLARRAPSSIFGYFVQPTPGGTNGTPVAGFVQRPDFDVDGRFHDTPFDLRLTTGTPGATIVFTTDGSAPTLANGTSISGGSADAAPEGLVRIATTTTLRAAAFKDGYQPSPISTRTYFFLNDVLRQPANIAGLPEVWDGREQPPVTADYEMDPQVADDPKYRQEILQGLKDIPTISIVMDPADLFGQEGGIYINSAQRGRAWERPASVEIIDPRGTSFQADAGIRIHGFSWRFHRITPKHSFRLEFRDEYGPRKLAYPLFPDAPVDRFDSIVLRAQGGRAWAGKQFPAQAQYLRDTFARDLAREMGAVDGHAALVHLYLNGVYWGLYNPVERPDAQMGAEYFGGSPDDYDALNRRTNTMEAIDGDLLRYHEMIALAEGALEAGQTTDDEYAQFERMVAMDDFIDWFIRNQYVTNRDGLTAFEGNNQRAIGRRVGDPQFRFFVWDMEFSLWDATDNNNIAPGLNDPPLAGSQNPRSHAWTVYNALRQNEEFRLRFADHVHRHLFNGGALTPRRAAEIWESRARSIERAVVAESARWGDAQREVPYTRDVEWQAERNRLLTQYFPQRTDILLHQYRSVGLYPHVAAPEFNQHGGLVSASFDLTLAAPAGTIYFTRDGSDPRQRGGQVAPSAMRWTRAMRLDRDTTINARVLLGEKWSALTTADFQIASDLPLRITEIDFDPHDANLVEGLDELPVGSDAFEFIEVANISDKPIELDGVRLVGQGGLDGRHGVTFGFAAQTLGAGERIVAVKHRAAFQSRYGRDIPIAAGDDGAGGADGEYGGQLDDRGDRLRLLDASGRVIQTVSYGIDRMWAERAAGRGSSLEADAGTEERAVAAGWRASSQFGGSPGKIGSGPERPVVVNEVIGDGGAGARGQFELYNTTDQPIDIRGWYVGDAAQYDFRHRFPAGTSPLDPHTYRAWDAEPLGVTIGGPAGGSLWLVAADASGRPLRFVDRVSYRGGQPGQSQGRWPDTSGDARLFPLQTPTPGTVNAPPLRPPVLLSEVHYRPKRSEDYVQRFDAGRPPGIAAKAGRWRVEAGAYHAVADARAADAIAIVAGLDRLTRMVTVSATVRVPSQSALNRNAVLIFDYQSPSDFKFASMHGGNGRWRMGRRDEAGWQFLATAQRGGAFPTGRDVGVVLELRGSVATLRSGDTIRVTYDFGESLADGRIGLATKGGEAVFDDLSIAPLDDRRELEFVELVNVTEETIDLSAWRLTGAVDHRFDPGTTLAAGETLVVTPFSGGDRDKLAHFSQRYGGDEMVRVAGPYTGTLADGQHLELLRPVDAADPRRGETLVDRAVYRPDPPWPAAADGGGSSLQRTGSGAFGDLAASWKPVPPTPGRAAFARAGDLNRDGAIDRDDIAALTIALNDPALYERTFDAPAAWAGDFDSDGDVDYDDIAGLVSRLEDGPA